jgi:hypothetical protein
MRVTLGLSAGETDRPRGGMNGLAPIRTPATSSSPSGHSKRAPRCQCGANWEHTT